MKAGGAVLICLFLVAVTFLVIYPNALSKAANIFIDNSNKVTTVMDYWANGGSARQPAATSGSESISFAAVTPSSSLPIPELNETNITDIVFTYVEVEEPPPVSPTQACEDNFKSCVDRAHAQYGVYVSVYSIFTAQDASFESDADNFYNAHHSSYQPAYPKSEVSYPIILIAGNAMGFGDFVAICKDGIYPEYLNSGLPC